MRIVNIVEDNDELEELLCPMCQKVGLQSLLGHKILLPNEVKQPDYDLAAVPKCAFLCPNYEAEPEPSIQDTITTIHNPFDNAQV